MHCLLSPVIAWETLGHFAGKSKTKTAVAAAAAAAAAEPSVDDRASAASTEVYRLLTLFLRQSNVGEFPWRLALLPPFAAQLRDGVASGLYADDAMEAAARLRVAAVIDHVVDLHALLLPVVDAFVSPRKALVEKKLKVRCAGNALPDDDFDGGCFHQVAVATGERLHCSHRHCKQPSAHCIDYCGAALSCRIK